MKFAKTLAFFYLSIFAATAFPMNHFAGKVNPSKEDKDLKWTTAKWYDNGDFETKALPSKPGPNDNTTLRWGNYKRQNAISTLLYRHTENPEPSLPAATLT